MTGKKPAVKLENPVLMGVIGAAQGLRGEVRVKSFTDEPVAISEYGTLYGADGRAFDHVYARYDRAHGGTAGRANGGALRNVTGLFAVGGTSAERHRAGKHDSHHRLTHGFDSLFGFRSTDRARDALAPGNGAHVTPP